jgi:2-hydroxychromene-2-carboxylate isomerase
MNPLERIKRGFLMRAVVAAEDADPGHALRVRMRRTLGRPARVELYFAFDDPYAAVALGPLREVLRQRFVDFALFPLVSRGIEDDPAGSNRARYALVDARRLARRTGRVLARTEPISAASMAYLARLTEALRGDPYQADFAEAALDAVWFGARMPAPTDMRALFKRVAGASPPSTFRTDAALDRALAQNHARLVAQGHWESPACWVEGAWYLAHERIAQIDERLAKDGF